MLHRERSIVSSLIVSRAIVNSSTCPLRNFARPRASCPTAIFPIAKAPIASAPTARAPIAVAPMAMALTRRTAGGRCRTGISPSDFGISPFTTLLIPRTSIWSNYSSAYVRRLRGCRDHRRRGGLRAGSRTSIFFVTWHSAPLCGHGRHSEVPVVCVSDKHDRSAAPTARHRIGRRSAATSAIRPRSSRSARPPRTDRGN